jgi:hypothetical protein
MFFYFFKFFFYDHLCSPSSSVPIESGSEKLHSRISSKNWYRSFSLNTVRFRTYVMKISNECAKQSQYFEFRKQNNQVPAGYACAVFHLFYFFINYLLFWRQNIVDKALKAVLQIRIRRIRIFGAFRIWIY